MQNVWDAGPIESESLWRYLSVDRCICLLDSARIYFAAATEFADPFEGAVAVQPLDFPIDPRYAQLDPVEDAFRQLKRLTKINCWHRATYESDAMWKLYAGASKGVAISSTPERMHAAFKPFRLSSAYCEENIWAGKVCYKDLLEVRMNVNDLERFFYKHQAFAWEREFRLAITVASAHENGVTVPDRGIEVDVDLFTLVHQITLGPRLSVSDRKSIELHAERLGLGDRIVVSSLLGRPRYV